MALLLLQVQGHREVERSQGQCAAPAAATTREHVVPAHTGEDPPLFPQVNCRKISHLGQFSIFESSKKYEKQGVLSNKSRLIPSATVRLCFFRKYIPQFTDQLELQTK
jgi:hypothetical protein